MSKKRSSESFVLSRESKSNRTHNEIDDEEPLRPSLEPLRPSLEPLRPSLTRADSSISDHSGSDSQELLSPVSPYEPDRHHRGELSTPQASSPRLPPSRRNSEKCRSEAEAHFNRGISLSGLREIARRIGRPSSFTKVYRNLGGFALPRGWTLSKSSESSGFEFVDARGFVQQVAPEGCKALMDVFSLKVSYDEKPTFGRPTHYISYPRDMALVHVVEAVAAAFDGEENPYLWIEDLTSSFIHERYSAASIFSTHESWATSCVHGIRLIGKVVQVLKFWHKPCFKRNGWLMLEAYSTVCHEIDLVFAGPPSGATFLTDKLRADGPDAVLEIVFGISAKPEDARFDVELDKEHVLDELWQLVNEVNKTREVKSSSRMTTELQKFVRRAYARAFDRLYATQRLNLGECHPRVLDLGHQLACLWALIEDSDGVGSRRAEEIFREVQRDLRKYEPKMHVSGAVGPEAVHINGFYLPTPSTEGRLFPVYVKEGNPAECACYSSVDKRWYLAETALKDTSPAVGWARTSNAGLSRPAAAERWEVCERVRDGGLCCDKR